MRILGVLENAIGPKQSVILARLEGGPLDEDRGHRGDERQPGVHRRQAGGRGGLRLPLRQGADRRHHPDRGDDRGHPTSTRPRAASARFRPPLGPGRPGPAPGPRGGRRRVPTAPADDHPRPAARKRCRPRRRRSRRWPFPSSSPASTPARSSGRAACSPVSASRPVMGASGGGTSLGAPARARARRPRSGVSLIEGDLDLSVTGTVTHIDQDRVYAFGHPFYNLGPTQFPMKKAYVYSVFPSLHQSWKIARRARRRWARWTRTALAAMAGRIGKAPRMIPVEVKLNTSRGTGAAGSPSGSWRTSSSPRSSPSSRCSRSCRANERAFGTSTIRIDGRLVLAGRREIRVEDLFTAGPAVRAGGRAGGRAPRLPHDQRLPEGDGGEARPQRSPRTRRPRAPPCSAPGSSAAARCGRARPFRSRSSCARYRGETRDGDDPAHDPRQRSRRHLHAAGGRRRRPHRLRAAGDAPALRAQATSTSSSARSTACAAATTSTRASSARWKARSSPASTCLRFPPRCCSVLGAAEQGASVVPIRTAAVWDFELPTDYAVTGSRILSLTVER